MNSRSIHTVKEIAHSTGHCIEWVRLAIRRLLTSDEAFKCGRMYMVTEEGFRKILADAASPRPKGRPKKEKEENDK